MRYWIAYNKKHGLRKRVMSIKLGKYSFTGPVESIDEIRDRSGVYVIVCKKDNEFFLLDVGESIKLRTRIKRIISS